MRRLAETRPLCIVVDDLQWADSLTIELLEDLLALTEEVQLGLVLIYRADRDQPSWRLGERARALFPHRYCEIELRPLPAGASRELAEALAETRAAGLARRSAHRARGRQPVLPRGGAAGPDRARRAAPARRRVGARRRAGRRADARAGRAAGAARPPAAAHARGRLGGERGRARLRAAAARAPAAARAGRAGADRPDAARPDRGGQPPTRAGVPLPPRPRAGGGLRQPARARRRSLHRRIGEALETLYGESSEAVYGPLARHFAEADEPERAARYLLLAGDAARAVYADHEAVEHYRRARTFLRRLERSGARARHALQDRARPPPGVRLRARRPGLRRRLRLLRRAAHGARAHAGPARPLRSSGPTPTRPATRTRASRRS